MVLALVAWRPTMKHVVLYSCLIYVDLAALILQMVLDVPDKSRGLSIKGWVVVDPSSFRGTLSIFLELIGFLLQDFNRFRWNNFDSVFEQALTISSRVRYLGSNGYVSTCLCSWWWSNNWLNVLIFLLDWLSLAQLAHLNIGEVGTLWFWFVYLWDLQQGYLDLVICLFVDYLCNLWNLRHLRDLRRLISVIKLACSASR